MDQETRDRCVEYATGLYARETETQRWIGAELRDRDLPCIQISPLEGRLLAILARAVDAERLLEIGTLGGYSALWLLSLLPGRSELVTMERNPEHAELAREAFRRAGEDRVDLRVGDARRMVRELSAAPPFDFAFIDADKAGYPDYLEAAASLLRPGGMVAADNALWRGKVVRPAEEGDEATAALRAYNRTVAEDPRFEGVVLPIRDGLSVARYVG
jgi:predicted O-methyltransferase YrrM